MNKLLGTINTLLDNPLIKENEVYKEELTAIQKRFEDKNFKLAIVGEFSSGKSTFINALIGKDLLKHATLETTATVTYIHNSESKYGTKIKVNYANGEIVEHKDYNAIKENTTTKSDKNVVSDIDFVDVYIPFVNISNELTIVDTPGLNGTADKHREKTIEEIKKAHACIYVLQKNGLTDSDREFIRFLFSYQNNFIFVQNFIDELKESEGEYLSKKLEFVNHDIENIIEGEKAKIDYSVVGVSALKGVVGKDKNISRLYENDIFDLTEERRQKYLYESNIHEVENTIKDLYKKKNNSKSRYNLTIHSLLTFLNDVIDKESDISKLNNEKIKDDDAFKDKELANKLIADIKEKQELIVEKLKNLVNSEFSKCKKLLNKNIEESLEKIEYEIVEIISSEINYELFDNKCKTQYFANELQRKIDLYKDELEENEYYIIQDIYKSMLKRLNEYSKYSSKKIYSLDKINLIETKKVDLSFKEKKQDIEALRSELYENKSNKEILESKLSKIKLSITQIENTYNSAQKKIQNIKENKIYAEKNLGHRPKKEIEYYDTIDVEVERAGLFKGFKNFLCGPKIEKKSVPRYSDKKGLEWDRKKFDINLKYQIEMKNINEELLLLRNQKNKLKNELDENSVSFEKSNRMIKFIDRQVQVKVEELKQYETNAKKEYLVTRKKQMIDNINKYLFSTQKNDKSIKEIFTDKVKFDFNENKKRIEKEISKECNRYIKNEIERLEAIKNGSLDELNKKYYNNLKYLNQLIEVYKSMGGI